MEKELILFVDDDQAILESSEILLSDEFTIRTSSSVSSAKDVSYTNITPQTTDLVLSSLPVI